MNPRRLMPTATWAVSLLAAIGTWILLVPGISDTTPGDTFVIGGWGGFDLTVAGLAFSTVGALVAARIPENRVGWIFCAVGLLFDVGNLAYHYADQALYGSTTWLPGGEFGAWSQNLLVPPAFGLIAAALVLFPDGRVSTARWRKALVPPLAGSALLTVAYALRGGPLDDPFGTVVNPVGIPGSDAALNGVASAGWLLMGLGMLIAAAAMRNRIKHTTGLQRQQLKWVALAAAFAGVLIAGVFLTFFTGADSNALRTVAFGLALPAVPVAAGVAILRYRLYDIDLVINRALVYGSLTATLAGVYVGSVLLLQLALSGITEGSGLAVAASTLAVAALFRPVRDRIQVSVDRRFFRKRYDAVRTLESFAVRLRHEVDLREVTADLRAVATETMQPSHVSLWLRGQDPA